MTSATEPAQPSSRSGEGHTMPVRPNEEAWTPAEIDAIRSELAADVERITGELETAESDLSQLMRDHGGGAGDDSADTGGKVLEREQELTRTHHARALLEQSRRALERLDDGSYGECELCGGPVGKARLQAFPRATMCVTCKQRQERR